MWIGKLIFIVFLGLTGFKSSAQDANMEIMMKMLSLKNSFIAKDSVTLSALLADDVTYGHTNGLIESKSQLIRSIMSGDQDYKTIDPSEMNIRMFDKTAIVNVRLKIHLIYNGKPTDLDMYAVLVWVKSKDWKLEARQSVKVQ
jgi:hypothetical protein